MIQRFSLLILLPLLLASCSTKNIFSDRGKVSYQSRSSDYHNFVAGELAFKNEDLDLSNQYFQSLVAKTDSNQNYKPLTRLIEIALTKEEPEEAIYLFHQKLLSEPKVLDYLLLSALYEADHNSEQVAQIIKEGIRKFPESKSDFKIALFLNEASQENNQSDLIEFINQQKDSKIYYQIAPIHAEALILSEQLDQAELVFEKCVRKINKCSWLENEYLEFLIRKKDLQSLKVYLETININNNQHIFAKEVLNEQSEESKIFEQLKSILSPNYENVAYLIRDYRFKFLSNFLKDEDPHSAIISLQVFSQLYPKFVPARIYLATFYSNFRLHKLAVKEFLRVPIESEEFLRSRVSAITILQQKRKFKEASNVLEELLALDDYKNDINLWLLQIRLFYEQRKFKELESLIPILLEEFPENQMLMFEYAVILQELNQDLKCLEVLDRLLKLNPNHQDALNFVAYTYAEAGMNLELAHQYVDQALGFSPQSPYYLDTKAWVFYKQGLYQEALLYMDKALKFLPDDPILLEHYGDVLMGLDRQDEAQVYYKKSLEMTKESDLNNEIRKLKIRLDKKVK